MIGALRSRSAGAVGPPWFHRRVSTTNAPLLVRRDRSRRPRRDTDPAGRRALEHPGGFLRVLGGPGTGKSALLAELAADRVLNRGVAPENVLVLTASRTAAASARSEITRQLTGDGGQLRTAGEPLVRTVHSYAFAVLRTQAVLAEAPPPRLLSGPEQDAMVRDLIAGDLENDAVDWPEPLRPALTADGFADQLRDLLARAAERGLGPAELEQLGARHDRPEWVAAGRFAREYEQVTLLRGTGSGDRSSAPALDAAELVNSALLAFDTDEQLLRTERERVRHVIVDDAQHLDPKQYQLICRLGAAASEFVLAGDPDQAVFSFRGADPRCLLESDPDGSRTVVLTSDHRMSAPVREAVQRLAERLPGSGPQRRFDGPDRAGAVQVRLLGAPEQEASWIADQLRRAHLIDGVPWSEMAVVVRSTALSLPVLRRALLAAGVPLALPADDVPLARRSAVRPLLLLLRCAARPEALDPEVAAELLRSSLGGADPLELRRLRRGLRRLEVASGGERGSGELLVEVLRREDQLAALDDASAAPARRLASLLRTASEAVEAGEDVERTLWKVWSASGLEQRWTAQARRGGAAGAQADRDLDAVVALFEAAAQFEEKYPGSDPAGFADDLEQQQIAGTSLAPSAPVGDAVPVLTAHAAAGREWEVVAIPGVQEGIWPDLRARGSLLGVERLVDLLSGVDGDAVSATAPLLAEERRLLLLALSRARRTALVSAVRGEDEQPSRFLDELEGVSSDPEAVQRPVEAPERGLVLSELVGELRRVTCDAAETAERRREAAGQLARLAAAGVPGAHPDAWYGLPEPSSTEPLVGPDEAVRVSPSTVDTLVSCPLRWMIERHGGQDAAELAAVTGTLVHALVQSAAEGADADQLRKALDQAWESVDAGAPWFSRRERRRVERMLDAFLAWLSRSRGELTQVDVERDLDLTVPGADGGPELRLRGRVDRLEADERGKPVIIDVKTGKTPVSKDDAEEHPQLAVYQLAAALGAFGGDDEPGGARLLYVAKPESRSGAATERAQTGFDGERVRVWLDVVRSAAASSTGPAFVATENDDCPRCPARTCCPVHPAGRQVGQ
jgi:superfamily I DNA/RNA helicase/RecB family exonuclease